MSEIQIGTSIFEEDDFLIAVQEMHTCGDCKHCQQNKKIPDKVVDWTCYHEDNLQQHLHNRQGMSISDDFLCNKFKFYT